MIGGSRTIGVGTQPPPRHSVGHSPSGRSSHAYIFGRYCMFTVIVLNGADGWCPVLGGPAIAPSLCAGAVGGARRMRFTRLAPRPRRSGPPAVLGRRGCGPRPPPRGSRTADGDDAAGRGGPDSPLDGLRLGTAGGLHGLRPPRRTAGSQRVRTAPAPRFGRRPLHRFLHRPGRGDTRTVGRDEHFRCRRGASARNGGRVPPLLALPGPVRDRVRPLSLALAGISRWNWAQSEGPDC